MSLAVQKRPSPNFNRRDPQSPLQYIVLHYTGMESLEKALNRMCDPASEVSAHYLIDRKGNITQLVEEDQRAWHAGRCFWRGVRDINSASIGIELENPGHEFGYIPFPSEQISALKELMRDIIVRHHLSPKLAPLGHSDVAPERKEDPGELFPWLVLAEDGLGLWPVMETDDYAPPNDGEAQELLKKIGYDCGIDETGLRTAILAFQRRYLSENMSREVDRETIARIRALARAVISNQ